MNIIVDDRETQSGIIELLKRSGAEVIVKRLLYGDYLIDGQLVVERKSAEDLVVSIIDGRVFRQLHNLKKLGLRMVLMIEGDPYRTAHNMHSQAVKGALVSIGAIWQVPVLFASSTADTACQFRMIAEQLQVCRDVLPLRSGYRPKRVRSRQLFIIQGLPGVGASLALRLLLHFKSVSGIFSATYEELVQVDGIGPIRARQIRDVLNVRTNNP